MFRAARGEGLARARTMARWWLLEHGLAGHAALRSSAARGNVRPWTPPPSANDPVVAPAPAVAKGHPWPAPLAGRHRLAAAGARAVRWARYAAVASVCGMAVGASLAYCNYLYWHESMPASFYMERLAARMRPGIFGPAGRWHGVVPPAADAIYSLDEVGVEMDKVPQDYLLVLLALEDRHAGQWYRGHIGGVDWPAVPVRFVQGIVSRGHAKGASTITMQLASMAANFKQDLKGRKFARKAREWAGAAELHEAMGGDMNRIVLAYAAIAPYARGLGGDVLGLVAAADIIFNKRVDQLSRGEAAVLASAPNMPIWIGEDSERARAAFANVKRRAVQGLVAAFGEKEAAAAVDEIQAMGELPPLRAVPEDLSAAALATAGARTRTLVLPVMPAIQADLRRDNPVEVADAATTR